MTTLTLTNVSQDLASLEMAGRRVYIERRAGRLRVYTLAGGLRTVGELLQGGSQQRQLQLLLELTYEMGEQNQALHEMRRIRQRMAGGEPPGDSEEGRR